ncbi:MAG: hypothetical protein ACUVTQ_11520 [Desulfotomaculales bacterium]
MQAADKGGTAGGGRAGLTRAFVEIDGLGSARLVVEGTEPFVDRAWAFLRAWMGAGAASPGGGPAGGQPREGPRDAPSGAAPAPGPASGAPAGDLRAVRALARTNPELMTLLVHLAARQGRPTDSAELRRLARGLDEPALLSSLSTYLRRAERNGWLSREGDRWRLTEAGSARVAELLAGEASGGDEPCA